MAYYLTQLTYTPETWAALIKNPTNRLEAVRPLVENLGGEIVGAWLAFGEYDIVTIIKAPDNLSIAALAMVFSAGGAAKTIKTTPLITFEEGIMAMQKAGVAASHYQPASKETIL
jgi:uncharacterized protein with GYD domain